MRAIIAVVLLGGGCEAIEPYPTVPGGGGPPISPGVDAPTADAVLDGGTMIAGRVCVVSDLRALTTCAATGAGGFEVALGGNTAITADDGAFEIATPSVAADDWQVTGTGIVTSLVPFVSGASTPLIPTTSVDSYGDLQLSNGVLDSADEGSIFIQVTRQGAPLAGVTAVALPAPTYLPFYDGVVASVWNQAQTSTAGVIWLAGVPSGVSAVEVRPPSLASISLSVGVVGQTITFATVDVP